MSRQITSVMQDAGHLNDAVIAAAIEKKVARVLHRRAAHPRTAQGNVIGPCAFNHDLRTFFRARPLMVRFNVKQRLTDEGSVTERCVYPEFLETPFHDGGNVAAR